MKNIEKIRELIRKYSMELGIKPNGEVGIRISRKMTKADEDFGRANKAETIAELRRIEAEKKARAEAKEAARQEEIRAIKAGEKEIELRWHDGDILSGWTAFGEAGDLLEKLGIAKSVGGWGLYIDAEVAEALGEEFTYAAALEFARPQLEARAEKERAAAEKAAALEAERASMQVEILKSGSLGKGEGSEIFANVKITDPNTGESLKFACRNIFDVGYAINPLYTIASGIDGGLQHGDYWQNYNKDTGWENVRELTLFEKKALDYLRKFPPISAGIRM